jgi:phosphonate transport system substrate-binding protein
VEKGSSQNSWKDLVEYISEKSDADVKRVTGDKYQTFMASLKGEKLDVAAVGPMQYMEVKDKYEPVAKLIRSDREFYYGIIFTRKDSGIKDIAGLKGKRIALVSKDSTSGYVYPVLKLYQSGLKLGTDYKGYFLNFHDAVASAVLDKKFDAGACFEDCRDTVMKDDAEKDAKTVVLAYTDEIPSEPIIVKKSLPPELKEKIRKAFLDLKAEKGLLKKISEGETEITGFEPVSEADYKGLDEALAQIKSFEKK